MYTKHNEPSRGRLIKIASGPNWDELEEAGSWGGELEPEDSSRLWRGRDAVSCCAPEHAEDFSAFFSISNTFTFLPSSTKPRQGRNLLPSFKKGPVRPGRGRC